VNGYYKLVIEQLKMLGFAFHRQGKGSHEIWCKGRLCVTVPHNCKSRMTANSIMKDAGIDKKF
jgi:predicted RNA binding protein YcfA (HicA-like mRNA interferase family)